MADEDEKPAEEPTKPDEGGSGDDKPADDKPAE